MNNQRRKLIIGGGVLFAAGALSGIHAVLGKGKASSEKVTIKANPRLGMNLSGIAYWGAEFPFADIMRQSSEWISQPRIGDWGTGPALNLDEHGWVTALAKGCKATKILATADSQYPIGQYTILYDGEGEIALNAPVGKIIKQGTGQLLVDVKGDGMLAIDIIATNPDNYLRNIRVILPSHLESYQLNPWNADFLARWSGVACVRVMDMMATNNATQKTWSDRPKLTDASYSTKGAPVELLVDLANRLNTDIWFCMPHMVDDNYIEQFARLVNKQLNPDLRAWVEYSNEVWNGGFRQFVYAAQQGKNLKLSKQDWEAAFLYNAHRSVQMFDIWQAEFSNQKRLVKVIASQAANSWLSEQLLKALQIAEKADVLAIAPYISMNIASQQDEHGLSAMKVAEWSLDTLFAHIQSVRLPESKRWIQDHKKVANTYGLKLVAYEAGQHLVGVQGGENNEQLTMLFKQANADKRMGDIYQQHLSDWSRAGGDLWCAFNSMSGWSKWGSWGLLESADKPTAKYRVTVEWAQSKGQAMRVMQ